MYDCAATCIFCNIIHEHGNQGVRLGMPHVVHLDTHFGDHYGGLEETGHAGVRIDWIPRKSSLLHSWLGNPG